MSRYSFPNTWWGNRGSHWTGIQTQVRSSLIPYIQIRFFYPCYLPLWWEREGARRPIRRLAKVYHWERSKQEDLGFIVYSWYFSSCQFLKRISKCNRMTARPQYVYLALMRGLPSRNRFPAAPIDAMCASSARPMAPSASPREGPRGKACLSRRDLLGGGVLFSTLG